MKIPPDKVFQDMLEEILMYGSSVETRNSIVTRARNLSATFTSTPLISIRRTAWRSAIREWEWFMSGSCNIEDLHESVRPWWKPWADENGDILNNYSKQFRSSIGIDQAHEALDVGAMLKTSHEANLGFDQIAHLIDGIKNHPYSRRNLITSWNSSDMASSLTPISNCHNTVTQLFVEPDKTLHMSTVQRSCDMVLGVPHNWIQQWAFLTWLASLTGYEVGSLHWLGHDCHIYSDHTEMANKIIDTDTSKINTPNLLYTPSSDDFKADDFSLDSEYKPKIKKSLEMTV